MPATGFKELQRDLRKLGKAVGPKVLRSAGMTATLPALRAAQAAVPQGKSAYGPYPAERGPGTFDPYPNITYKGNIRFAGFTSRHIARKSRIFRNKRGMRIMIGVRPEAWYALVFYELGTSKIPANPWLVPSFKASISEIDRRFRSQLRKKIDQQVLKKGRRR